jgi:hypothetical protein
VQYGHHGPEVVLFCRFPRELRRLILEPLAAKYPACRFAEVKKETEQPRLSHWYAQLRLTPELYPILRHAQFEDLLTRDFEDPIDAVLKAVQPEEGIESRVEIAVQPAGGVRRWFAKRAVKRLDGPFFRRHFELAGFYARRITRRWAWMLAWPLGLLARGFLRLSFPEEDRRRMNELAEKASLGTLTAGEQEEVDSYERVGHLLPLLKSKARRSLKGSTHRS